MKETQCKQILNMIERNGSVTGMDCYEAGIMNYKGRVNDLRKMGYPIVTKMETRVNANGERKTFARYSMGVSA